MVSKRLDTREREWLDYNIELIQQFRPCSPEVKGKVWHDQIKSQLYLMGILQGFVPLPELVIEYPESRRGKGRIDMVWAGQCKKCGLFPIVAFEIDSI